MAKARRVYDDGPKLNIKKVIGAVVVLLIIVALIVGIKKMLDNDSNSVTGKIENVYYYTIYDNGKWGVIDSYGKTVVSAMYDEMIVIPNQAKDIFICTYNVDYSKGTYKTKVINSKNKEIIKDYDKIEAVANYDKNQNIWYENDVFRVEKNGKYGLVNYSGKELLAPEYDSINVVTGIENSLIIEKDGNFGLCDDAGNILIEPGFKEIKKIGEDYKNGYIVVNSDNKYGIIGFDKKVVLEPKYDEIKGICGEGLYVIKENDKYIVANKSGEKVLSKGYEDILSINKEYIIAVDNKKCGVVDIHGATKIPFNYDNLIYANGTDYIAKTGDKYGIMSVDGSTKLSVEATSISYVSSGNFYIADYIENGKLISKVYNSSYEAKVAGIVSEVNASKGYIRVHTDNDYKYYNFKFEEKSASGVLTTNTLFLSKKDGKYGFIDKTGKVIIDYIYDDATEQNSSGYAGIKKDGLWGSIDINGKVVAQPTYNLDNNTKIDFIGNWHLCEDVNANYYIDV